MTSEEKNTPKKDWQDSLETLKADLEASERPRQGIESSAASGISEEGRTRPVSSGDRGSDSRKELKTGKSFLFRKKEWGVRELSDEFFRLKGRMIELQDERNKSRLSDKEWQELRNIQDELEYIGPEVEWRDKDARKARARRASLLRRERPVSSVANVPVQADDAVFSLGQIGKEIIDMLPKEGKKTFLDDDTVKSVAELAKIKSAIHNNQEEIRKAKKTRKPTDVGKLISLQNRRDAIVETLKAVRVGLNDALSGTDSDGNTTMESSERGREERRLVRKKFQLSHAAEELGFVIGEAERGRKSDVKENGISSLPDIAIDEKNLSGAESNPDLEPAIDQKTSEDIPSLESDAERLIRRAEALRSESESHDSYLRTLEAERIEVSKAFEASLSKWSEQMKKIEEIRSVLTGLKSGGDITAKMEAEKPVTTDDLRKIDEEMTRIEKAKKKTREELATVTAELESLTKAPDAVPDAVPIASEPVTGSPEIEVSEGQAEQEQDDQEPETEAPLVKPLPSEPDSEPTSPDESEVPEEKGISDAVQEKFKGLGITRADLLTLEGFSEDLTEGQQLFVAESLSQVAARNIEDTARDTAKGGIFKSYYLAKARKEIAEKVLHGGIDEYRKELGQLIEGVKMSGLDVEEKNDGTFDIRFLSDVPALEGDESAKAEWDAFNGAANAFSKIPQEWSLPEASKNDRRKYDEAKRIYDVAQDRLSGFIDRERTDPNGYEAVRDEYVALRVADNRVRLVQHLQAHPEIGKHLEKLERQNLFAAALATAGTERAAYFAGGAAGRLALMGAGVASLAAAPIVASILGGVTGYRRAKETLAEQDRKARRGIESPAATKGSENGGWLKKLVGKPEEISQEKLEAGKRSMVHAAAPEKDDDGRKRGLAERLDIINERVAKLPADDTEGMKQELKNLVARVDYVKKKLDDDQVVFGDGTEGIRSRIYLLEALSRAETTVGIFTDVDGDKERSVSYRFERMFGERQGQEEERVKSARSDYRWFETKKGAVMSGTIALLGAGVAQGAHAVADWLHYAQSGVPTPVGSGAGTSSHEVADKAAKAVAKIKGGVASDSTIPHGAPIQLGVKSMAPAGALKEEIEHQATGKVANVAPNVFTETAKPGDGMTHLARRALAEYVKEHVQSGTPLSAEQKVYIEDYLQKKIAHAGTLQIGSKVEFSKDLMDEAIGRTRGLNESQLRNLKQFADQVHEFRTKTVPVAEAPVAGPANAVAEAVAPAPAPAVPTEALDIPTPKGPVAPDTANAVPGPKVPQIPDPNLPDTAPAPKAFPNLPADAEVYGPIPPKGDRPFFWSPKENRQVFREIGRIPARDVPKIIIRAARKPFWDGTGMDPRRARYIGDLFLEARREGIIPGKKPFHEFLDQVARSHHDPERMKVFADSADIARRYGVPDKMNNE